MARRFRRSSRRGGFFRSKRRSGRSRSDGNPIMTIGGAMAYGAARARIAGLIQPITNMIPLGNISDEVVLGGISYLAYKKIKNPIVKKIALGGLIVESARIGEQLIQGTALGGSSSSSSLWDGGMR